MKKCNKCLESKSADKFYKNSKSKDGLHGTCKPCFRERQRARSQKFRQENPEYDRQWRKNNAAKKRQLLREWQKNNRNRVRGYEHARRARMAGAFADCQRFSQEFIRSVYKSCLKCGSLAELEIDHVIPLSKGGTSTIGNYQILCRSCNASKNNRDFTDYRLSYAVYLL